MLTSSSHSRPPYVVLIALLGALAGLTPLAIDMYLPSIPTMATEFSVPVEIMQYTVSFYLLGFAFGQLLYGPLTDSLGRMPILMGGLGLFALASVACALAQSVEQLIAARVLQAVGGAAGSVVVMALLRDLFERDQFARAMSFGMLVMNLAPLLAPVLGGYLLLFFGWHSVFWLLAGVAALLALSIGLVIGETLPKAARSPLKLSSALATYGRILRHRECMGYQVIGIGASAALFAFITGSPFVYIQYYGVPPEQFGYYFGANILMMMTLTSLNARYVARLGSSRMLGIGLGIGVTGAMLLVFGQWLQIGDVWEVVVPVVLIMGPMGLISANAAALSLDAFDGAAGSVSALGGFMRFLAGALIGGMMGLVHTDSPWAMVGAMSLCLFSSGIVYLWMVRGRMAPQGSS
ncbi:Bcr/CflA family multidrug efflux MFS transporter [Ferrimonas balearica]|uniref:Bcr/CflA family multidrug efflux MFS transporter n=1 Tax=Ferrimonas balearica TaxID=44012 RepID=UPI001C9958F8|nr:Bcr/CflA family multidrug efflux MFS transporter [Ferrimonas balearica]MBY5922874.1 Bcr/CflA family multidrug efflux MFS transporter [Ferrimonas balearica]MBY5997749.1 Bcr/CflA family multidrug efflux MFS transporter [Ferrimonas balearica]